MSALLVDRGFSVDVRTGERATRAGILDGYDALIARAEPDEPAVFYYTGHGFRGTADISGGRYWQAICPSDVDASTTQDFRGITAWELSILQARLTARTRNVTTILDCCYASQMSRELADCELVPRALSYPSRIGLDVHFLELRARYGDVCDDLDPIGNRDAVRLVACAEDECAVMYRTGGECRGAFTAALVEVLHEVGDASVSWADLAPAVRARVRRVSLVQQPQIEGPARRRPFSLEELTGREAVAIVAVPGGFRLAAGCLSGVQAGDVYGVIAPDTRTYRAVDIIAEVLVREVSRMFAHADLRAWRPGHTTLSRDSVAILVAPAPARYAVRLVMSESSRPMVSSALESVGLGMAGPDDVTALATLRVVAAALTVEDAIGPLHHPLRFPDDLPCAVARLAWCASAQRLRELAGAHGVLADELAIEWGTVVGAAPRRMPDRGGALAFGDRCWIRVQSMADRDLYLHIFHIGVTGAIRWLTPDFPIGIALDRHEPEYVYGRRVDGAVIGVVLHWRDEVPPQALLRTEDLIVIVTATRTCLRGLETQALGTAERGDPAGQHPDALTVGGSAWAAPGTQASDGFFVRRLWYFLHPAGEKVMDTQ